MKDGPVTLLASMPWASASRPSLGIGTLVAAAKTRGFDCSSTYPNLLMSSRIGPEIYESLAETPALFTMCEHVFAVDVFGKDALRSDAFLDGFASDETARSLRHLRDVIVPEYLDECVELLLRKNPDIIGFSCTFNQVLPSLAAAKRIKALRPETLILLGGACVHDKMGEAYARAFRFVDHVFTGEADHTFVRFLEARAGRSAEDIASIPGVTSNGAQKAAAPLVRDMDSLPVPDYEDYFTERDLLARAGGEIPQFKNIPFESSRGCWWGEKRHCTFCGLNNEGMKYRTKSDHRVIRELTELASRYQCVRFMAADNILDHGAYRGLLRELASLPADLDLFYEIKANVRRDDVAALARAGVLWVQPGIESFADRVLANMQKGVSGLQNVQLLKWLHEYRITPSFNILVGFEGESDDDYDESIATMDRIHHLPPPSGKATIVQVHRFSPFFYAPEAHGIINMRPEKSYSNLIPPDVLAPDEFAYFFERDIPPSAAVFRHLERLNESITRWHASTRRVSARLGAGFMEVLVTEADRETSYRLDRASAFALVLADQQVELAKLKAHVLKAVPGADVEAVLGRLVEQGLLLESRGKVVSVVPYERAHTSEDLRTWASRWSSDGQPVEPDVPDPPNPGILLGIRRPPLRKEPLRV
ncbi:RiPP maturation radical SAM C-methyltransferase [Sorangium sp. So ce513]|uniref:RiPP maturation radical SAM C-methyltransferase n=1 Tax=Sorangium sp. So ce513 TaxID=3133315 RepID=UPI003F60C0D0